MSEQTAAMSNTYVKGGGHPPYSNTKGTAPASDMGSLSAGKRVVADPGLSMWAAVMITLVATILGALTMMVYAKLGSSGVFTRISSIDLTGAITGKLGSVGLVLYPLAALLVFLVLKDLLYLADVAGRPASFKCYRLILFAGPNLGLYGTFSELGAAFQGMDISVGLQKALGDLGVHIGQALGSTMFGIALALISFTCALFLNRSGEEEDL